MSISPTRSNSRCITQCSGALLADSNRATSIARGGSCSLSVAPETAQSARPSLPTNPVCCRVRVAAAATETLRHRRHPGFLRFHAARPHVGPRVQPLLSTGALPAVTEACSALLGRNGPAADHTTGGNMASRYALAQKESYRASEGADCV